MLLIPLNKSLWQLLCYSTLIFLNLLLYLTTVASNYAVGTVLSQGEVGKVKPIAFASVTLNKQERNYSTTEKEILGILLGVDTFRPYL